MPDRSFVIVAVIAFAAPFVRELLPPVGVPSIVFELVGGIIVGPQVLAIASTTPPVELFSQIGLAALLFLAGREIQVDKLRGTRLRKALSQFAIGMLIAGAIAVTLGAVGLIEEPLLVAIVFAATSLSIIIVPLRESGLSRTGFGQQVIATAAIAEFGAVILLSFFFSHERPGAGTELLHLSAFVLLAVLVFLSVSRGSRSARLMAAVERLRAGSTQIQVRADLALVAVVVALANSLGLESILAAFTVGIIRGMTSPGDRVGEERLDTVALGIFIPFFFIASGIDFHARPAVRHARRGDPAAALRRRAARRAHARRARLPVADGPGADALGRPVAGDVLLLRDRRHPDRPAAGHHGAVDRRRSDRGGPDLGDRLPGARLQNVGRRAREGLIHRAGLSRIIPRRDLAGVDPPLGSWDRTKCCC